MKKVSLNAARPSQSQNAPANVDDWIENRNGVGREPMKRLTIDVPLSLHKRIKSQCVMQELVMADVIREMLEQHFPQREGGSS